MGCAQTRSVEDTWRYRAPSGAIKSDECTISTTPDTLPSKQEGL